MEKKVRAKTYLIILVLILVAFGVGYLLGYWKLYTAEKEWATEKKEMQTKIGTLEKELAQAKARESLREIGDTLEQISNHLAEKNFGLAVKALDGLKQTFLSLQTTLGGEVRGQFDFFLPALEDIKKDAESLSPEARKKVDELKKSFDQALRPAKKIKD